MNTLPTLEELRSPSVTDQVFNVLYERIINLTLQPGSKLSEAEVTAQMGISRQPVRDAFYRLSQLGFVQIRPQRATMITYISEAAVEKARFIRTALEVACIREAARQLSAAQLDSLEQMVERQAAAVDEGDHPRFHEMDDDFHRHICKYSELDFAWSLIRENKGHMDRARFLSLGPGSPSALADHRDIVAALRARDGNAAAAAMKVHLSRITGVMGRLRAENPTLFGDAP